MIRKVLNKNLFFFRYFGHCVMVVGSAVVFCFSTNAIAALGPEFTYGSDGLWPSKSIAEWLSKANSYYSDAHSKCVSELAGTGLNQEYECRTTLARYVGTYNPSNATYFNGVPDPLGVIYEIDEGGNGNWKTQYGGIRVKHECSLGFMEIISTVSSNSYKVECGGYKALQLQEIEPLSCGAPPSVIGNPIRLANGGKVQHEHIEIDGFAVDYYFDSAKPGADIWPYKPDEILRRDKLNVVDKSKAYTTKSEACTSGLAEFKSRASATSWIHGVEAEYTCACLLKKNGQTVSALGIADAGEAGVTATSLDVLQYKHSSGALTNYVRDCSSGQYKSFSPNVRDIIQIDANGLFQIQTAGGKKTFNTNGQLSATYNTAGQLENRYGYNAQGDLISVQDEQGQQFIYNFTNGLLNSIQSPGGKTLQFNYSGTLLNKVIHPDQSNRIYHYEDTRFPKYLTGITDERGVRYATWKYDDQGRAISSEHAGGVEKTSLNFNSDGSTTVTNALGKKTTYSFTDILGVRRVSKVTGEPTASCVGAYQSYTYTPQGQVETKTDWNGNVTRFTYDFFGRELTKTLAYGTAEAKAIQTCWHETLNQPSRIIEPTKITLFDYTATGQLKSQIVKPRPAGAVDCSTAL